MQLMGLGVDEIDSFSPTAVQRPFSASNQLLDLQPLASSSSSSTASSSPSSPLSPSSIAQYLSRVYKLYLTFFDQAIRENIAHNRAKAQAAIQQSRAQAAVAAAQARVGQQQSQQPATSASTTHQPALIQQTLQTRTQALTAQQQAIQSRAQALAQAKANHAQAQAVAAAQAHTSHTLIPHGIPLTQFLIQYVGLLPPYVESLSPQDRFTLLEWTQLTDAELKVKTGGKEGLIGIVNMVKDTLNEMREGQSSGVRERKGFTTSVAVGIVLPGMKLGPPSAPPPSGPVPPVPSQDGPGKKKEKESTDDDNGKGGDDVWDDEQRQAILPTTRFISSGLKGEPFPPPEPKMGSKASFGVVSRLIKKCNSEFLAFLSDWILIGLCTVSETSLDNTMDSIIIPAERLPEHHALLDKVSQAYSEIDSKLAMIHDVLQEESYIERMIITVSSFPTSPAPSP